MIQQTVARRLTPPQQPEGFRLRKVEDDDGDYVDYLHGQALMAKAKTFPWPLVGVPLLLILFLYLGPMLWWIDATAAVPDIGVLSLLVLSALAVLFFQLLATWLAWSFFSRLAGFDRSAFRSSFQALKPWKQIGYYVLVLLSLFWGLVVVLAVMV